METRAPFHPTACPVGLAASAHFRRDLGVAGSNHSDRILFNMFYKTMPTNQDKRHTEILDHRMLA